MKKHQYNAKIHWTGNQGKGTENYKVYKRDYTISINGKSQDILGSSDPAFLGDNTRYNPEEFLVASVSSCHMLWYLHLCATNNIVVTNYTDNATGIMEETKNGSGKFTSITLQPNIIITNKNNIEKAKKLHKDANKMCFIANSLNFNIEHKASISALD
ncbi:OsmC family protein [Aurantibacter sp.]|uniref:OsmC family protein n=1 Tax=Aurantibacter sp. TaxID=2807103 RepID=UPI0035C82C4C